jgi:prevent-host-death family protein
MARRVGTTDLRQRLTDLLQAVRDEHETYVVETFGRPQAALVNLDEYEQFQHFQQERQAFFDWLEDATARDAEQNAEQSGEQMLTLAEQAHEQVSSEGTTGDGQALGDAETVRESAALYGTEQVVIGKLAWAAEDGQLSVFPLPKDLSWLRHFSARHLAEFFAELLDTLLKAQQTEDWGAVTEAIESWKATANIEADSALVQAVDDGQLDLQEGRGTSWSALRQELEL